jgi:hypothetical protein
LGRLASRWRFELSCVLAGWCAYCWLASRLGAWPLRVLGVLVIGAALGWPVSRRLVVRRLVHARVRRQLLRGSRRVGLVTAEDRVPLVWRIRADGASRSTMSAPVGFRFPAGHRRPGALLSTLLSGVGR